MLQNNGLASSPGRQERTSSRLDSWWSTVSRERRWAVVQKLQRNFLHRVHLDTGGSLLLIQFSQLIWLTEELSSAMTVNMFWANRFVCNDETPSPGIYKEYRFMQLKYFVSTIFTLTKGQHMHHSFSMNCSFSTHLTIRRSGFLPELSDDIEDIWGMSGAGHQMKPGLPNKACRMNANMGGFLALETAVHRLDKS